MGSEKQYIQLIVSRSAIEKNIKEPLQGQRHLKFNIFMNQKLPHKGWSKNMHCLLHLSNSLQHTLLVTTVSSYQKEHIAFDCLWYLWANVLYTSLCWSRWVCRALDSSKPEAMVILLDLVWLSDFKRSTLSKIFPCEVARVSSSCFSTSDSCILRSSSCLSRLFLCSSSSGCSFLNVIPSNWPVDPYSIGYLTKLLVDVKPDFNCGYSIWW